MQRMAAFLVWLVVLAGFTPACADEFKVLSAGAVEPGLHAVIADFEKATGHTTKVTFNTAPQIRKRLEAGDRFDVVVAPPAVLEEFAKAGKLHSHRAAIGRVGLGVAVRADAPVPDIADAEALKKSIGGAQSIVFNRASTGLYFEGLLKKLGVYDAVEKRITRYDTGAQVMEHVLKGSGNEIGFGAITEILLYKDKGLRFVGPLPASVQNYTTYAAAAAEGSPPTAEVLVHFLGSPRAKALFVAAGIE